MSYYEILYHYQTCSRERLIREADVIMANLLDYFSSFLDSRQATLVTIGCALYFADGDCFIDRYEASIIKGVIGRKYDIEELYSSYKYNDFQNAIESGIKKAPYYIKEEFVKLGCIICAADGFVNSDEHLTIDYWC